MWRCFLTVRFVNENTSLGLLFFMCVALWGLVWGLGRRYGRFGLRSPCPLLEPQEAYHPLPLCPQ